MKKVYIITRTHHRPNEFQICYESIKSQTILPIWYIISDSSKNNYINSIDIPHKIINVNPGKKKWWIKNYMFANGYFNEVLPLIPDGNFVYFLDDDDKLIDKDWIKKIIENNVDILMGKFQMGSDHKYKLIGDKIQRGFIGTSCIAIKSEIAKKYKWPLRSGGDFMYISQVLKNHTPKYLDSIIAGVQTNLNRSWKSRKSIKLKDLLKIFK